MAAPSDRELLDTYRQALEGLANAQAYTMPNGRSVTRADIAEIRQTIEWLESRINVAENPGDATGFVRIW